MNSNYNQATPKDLNLASLFGASVNLPSVTETIDGKSVISPLYPRGVKSNASAGIHGGEWQRRVGATYNSPRNVRIVCLGKNGAHVGYWAEPIVSGEKRKGYQFSAYTQNKKPVVLQAGSFTAKDAGLKCIAAPYVLGNIEELWITADAFICPNAHPAYMKIYQTVSSIPAGKAVPDTQKMLGGLLQSVLPNGKTVQDMFPVLRAIVVVSIPQGQTNFHKATFRSDEIRSLLSAKYQGKRRSIGELLLEPDFKHTAITAQYGYLVCPVPSGDITKFSLGDYKFDEQYLTAYRAEILRKYGSNSVLSASTAKAATAEKNPPAPELSAPTKQETSQNEVKKKAILAEVIKVMEDEFDDINVIKQALFAYRAAHPKFFEEQIPLLPAGVKQKYSAVFEQGRAMK